MSGETFLSPFALLTRRAHFDYSDLRDSRCDLVYRLKSLYLTTNAADEALIGFAGNHDAS